MSSEKKIKRTNCRYGQRLHSYMLSVQADEIVFPVTTRQAREEDIRKLDEAKRHKEQQTEGWMTPYVVGTWAEL